MHEDEGDPYPPRIDISGISGSRKPCCVVPMRSRAKTTKVSYTCKANWHTASGIIDAGPNVNVWLDKNGTLYLRGPKINYSVENVDTFSVEEVWI